ncbi:hypothetical protein NDU88_002124 [Pleurodeles waltl]|uniref:Uncharacterized protein n=1 Tax=Pleurodeles waltl TaxID=8319 RepID=A0AAV7LNF6_PLEWA|nr:hypothetical protein NDU88_002124 [Pleurodeles waltl]
MGKDKAAKAVGTRAITQYTTPRQSTQRLALHAGENDDDPPGGKHSGAHKGGLDAHHSSLCSALEQQIETVSIDLNSLRTDLRKVSEKVYTAESNIGLLQVEMASLKKKMTTVHAEVAELGRRTERSRRSKH